MRLELIEEGGFEASVEEEPRKRFLIPEEREGRKETDLNVTFTITESVISYVSRGMRATARMRGWYRFIVRARVCVCECARDRSRMAKGISTRPWCGSIAAKLEKNIRFLIETTLRENLPPTHPLLPPSLVTVLSLLQTALKPVSTGPFSTLSLSLSLWYHDLSPIGPQKVSNCAFQCFFAASVKSGKDRVSFRSKGGKEGGACRAVYYVYLNLFWMVLDRRWCFGS